MTVGVPRPLRDSSTLPVDEWGSFSSSARDEYGLVLRTRIRRFPAEVRDFIEKYRGQAPRGEGLRSERVRNWQKLLIEHGYTARTVPAEYGGHGGASDILKGVILAEEFAAGQVPGGLGGQGTSMLVPTLLEHGTEEQKRTFIPPTLSGEMIWCQGYSEPNAGSDLASLRTSAVPDGDDWVVNGSKIWTSTAHLADWMFCLVRTEPEAPKHRGISFLLIKMDTPGIEIRPLVDMTMARNFNEIFLTDVRIPKDRIVGKRGESWSVANAGPGHERESLGDPNASLTRLHRLIALMREETVTGQRAIDNAAFRDRLMRIQARVMAMRCNDLRVLSSRLNNTDAGLAVTALRLAGSGEQQAKYLPRVANGDLRIGAALSEVPGARADAGVRALEDGTLSGKALFVIDGQADAFLVADREQELHIVESTAPGVGVVAQPQIDRMRSIVELKLDNAPADALDSGENDDACLRMIGVSTNDRHRPRHLGCGYVGGGAEHAGSVGSLCDAARTVRPRDRLVSGGQAHVRRNGGGNRTERGARLIRCNRH